MRCNKVPLGSICERLAPIVKVAEIFFYKGRYESSHPRARQVARWDTLFMMQIVSEFVTYVSALNTNTWLIIWVLVVAGAFIMQQIVDSKMLTVAFLTAFQAGALFINFVAQKLGITVFSTAEMDLIAASTLGMIFALFAALLAMRGVSVCLEFFQPKVPGSR
ncbi:MAG: hypothetical protein H6875_12195 [Hyphomicrobiaceae bacterium]|nr:hypothetical protein [Hyphomicrobiaceae bacterium]